MVSKGIGLKTRLRWLTWGALVAAAAIRVAIATNQFWLDEIWSLGIARNLHSPLEVLTRVHLDNNHHLNTLWLYVCGLQTHWFVYRLPSLAAGIGTVILAERICRRWGERTACFATLLTGSSYLLIVYATEARGYALAGFFALTAFLALERYLARGSLAGLLLFWTCAILGLLSHLTYFYFYIAAGFWSLIQLLRQRTGWLNVLRRVAYCHLVPLLGLASLYAIDLRQMQSGGGPNFSLADVVRQTTAVALGVVAVGPAAWISAGIVSVAGSIGLAVLWKRDSALAAFFAVVIVVSPAAALMLRPPDVLFIRYFYINILFYLLLLAVLLSWISEAHPFGKLPAWLAVTAIVTVNSFQTMQMLRAGRGDYLGLLQYMELQSRESIVHIGSDHDFRNDQVIGFYAKHVRGDRPIQYHRQNAWPSGGPEWIILSQGEFPEVVAAAGHRYDLVRVAPSAALTGITWGLYHKV